MLAALLFVYLFFISLTQLSDPDLWWHLKTGELIVENHELPGNRDVFSYTTPYPIPKDTVSALRGQWIGQAVFYLVYKFFGYGGLSVLRSLLIVFPFAFMYAVFVRKGAYPLLCLAALAFPPLAIILGFPYTFERPQAFSFILLPVMYVLLERLRQGRMWAAWALPVLLLAWLNIHGGAIVGIIILCAYIIGLAAAVGAGRLGIGALALELERPVMFVIGTVASIAVFLSSPNGYFQIKGWAERARNFVKGMLQSGSQDTAGSVASVVGTNIPSPVLSDVLEYKPLMYFYREMGIPWPLYMAIFLFLAILLVAGAFAARRKIDLPMALVSILIAGFGFYYVRGVNFSLVFFGFAICATLGIYGGRWRLPAAALMIGLVAVTMTVAVRSAPWQVKPSIPRSWINQSYPAHALKFMKDSRIEGPIFNDMRWGGFIIWNAWPQYTVFMDGRAVDDSSTNLYLGVMKGAPVWKSILGAYNVNVIMVPVMSMENGSIFPVLIQLAMDENRDWRLVYLKDNVALLVRNIPKNAAVIEASAMSYEKLYSAILGYSELMMITQPASVTLMFNKGFALYGLKRYDEARQILSAMPLKMSVSDELLRRMKK